MGLGMTAAELREKAKAIQALDRLAYAEAAQHLRALASAYEELAEEFERAVVRISLGKTENA